MNQILFFFFSFFCALLWSQETEGIKIRIELNTAEPVVGEKYVLLVTAEHSQEGTFSLEEIPAAEMADFSLESERSFTSVSSKEPRYGTTFSLHLVPKKTGRYLFKPKIKWTPKGQMTNIPCPLEEKALDFVSIRTEVLYGMIGVGCFLLFFLLKFFLRRATESRSLKNTSQQSDLEVRYRERLGELGQHRVAGEFQKYFKALEELYEDYQKEKTALIPEDFATKKKELKQLAEQIRFASATPTPAELDRYSMYLLYLLEENLKKKKE